MYQRLPLTVTEGEDKPLKYPTIFNSADAAVITKTDLAEPVIRPGSQRVPILNPCARVCR
jgi:Ni2+-binding GTPase involved in maturation of urease and hydrogenase